MGLFLHNKAWMMCKHNRSSYLKDTKSFLSRFGTLGFVTNNIKSDSLGERATLTNSHNISFLHWKCGAAMSGNILVSFLKTTVLSNVMKIVPSYNQSSLHLGGNDLSLENSSSNGDVTGKRALLVNKRTLDSRIGGFDTKPNVLHKAHRLLTCGSYCTSTRNEDGILLLVCLLMLIALDVILSYAGHV